MGRDYLSRYNSAGVCECIRMIPSTFCLKDFLKSPYFGFQTFSFEGFLFIQAYKTLFFMSFENFMNRVFK